MGEKRLSGSSRLHAETVGLAIGGLGVLMFSLTLPAAHMAVGTFGSLLVGPGRALFAAVVAGLWLVKQREHFPDRRHWPGLAFVAGGTIFSFPLLTAWAMGRVSASHGSVVLALMPLATAGASAIRHGERPSIWFWASSAGAAAAVIAYLAIEGLGAIRWPDIALLAAVAIVAFANAEGGRLAQELGGRQVIAWAVLFSVPALVLLVSVVLLLQPVLVMDASGRAWAALVYLGIGSQFFGFMAWYTGMALGGVARVSQLQYLQPFMTIGFSWVLLGESLRTPTILAASIVVVLVAAGQRAPIRR